MSSLAPKDRVSLCSFTFSDGRRCRTPRIGKHPHFCFHHAQKEARARTAEKLAKDLSYFFSADYLSACDLSTALATLIPAVVRGDLKPKTAYTVSYMVQTLLQAIHLSKHEYINAFGSDGWRKSIYNSVNDNHDYRFPPDPKPEQPPDQAPRVVADRNLSRPGRETGEGRTPHVAAGFQTGRDQPSQPAPSPMPSTSAEFVQQVIARLPRSVRPGSTGETGGGQAPQPAQATQPTPAQTRSPIPTQAPSTPAPAPSPTSARAPQTPASPSSPVYHPERSDRPVPTLSGRFRLPPLGRGPCRKGPHLNHPAATTEKPKPIPLTQPSPPTVPTPQPNNPPLPRPSTPRPEPDRSAPWLHFADTRIPPDSKLL